MNAPSATTAPAASPRRRAAAGRESESSQAFPLHCWFGHKVGEARAYASEVPPPRLLPQLRALLEHGGCHRRGRTMAAGGRANVLARLRRYATPASLDWPARVVPAR
jgi:hypothetical protein